MLAISLEDVFFSSKPGYRRDRGFGIRILAYRIISGEKANSCAVAERVWCQGTESYQSM